MNILVVGQSVVDKIIYNEGFSIKPGGIFYSVVAILSQIQPEDKVYLCSSIDKENEQLFKDTYDKIEKEFLVYVNSIPHVELVINNVCERNETYSQAAQNLLLPVEDLNRFDGILINMISGFDISLEQLKHIRKNYSGLIYFDVHTFSRGLDENGHRNFRQITDFDEWAECIDILQANESELLTLSGQVEEAAIVDELFSYGIKQIIITRAERGATVYLKNKTRLKKITRMV